MSRQIGAEKFHQKGVSGERVQVQGYSGFRREMQTLEIRGRWGDFGGAGLLRRLLFLPL